VFHAFAWIWLIIGIVFLPAAHVLRAGAKQQNGWIPVQGSILSSEVRFNGEEYFPCVQYEYKYEGEVFRGTLIRSGLITYNWKGPAKRVCANYPVGAVTTVHVNPADPSRAVLEPGGDINWLPFAYGFSIFSLVLAWLAFVAR